MLCVWFKRSRLELDLLIESPWLFLKHLHIHSQLWDFGFTQCSCGLPLPCKFNTTRQTSSGIHNLEPRYMKRRKIQHHLLSQQLHHLRLVPSHRKPAQRAGRPACVEPLINTHLVKLMQARETSHVLTLHQSWQTHTTNLLINYLPTLWFNHLIATWGCLKTCLP